MSGQMLSNAQRKLIWEFEGWLMENKIGYPNDGRSIPIPRDFDENTMMAYHVKEFDRIFVLELDEIPKKFINAI